MGYLKNGYLGIAVILFFSLCNFESSDTANPITGANFIAPVITSFSADTSIDINDTVAILATAEDKDGTVSKYIWSLNGLDYRDTTTLGFWKVSYSDTGSHKVFVKVIDNDGAESAVDSCIITVNFNSPSVIMMSDTFANVSDTIYVTVTGTDNGNILQYIWKLDGVGYAQTVENSLPLIFSDTGTHIVTVIAIDDDGLLSVADSCVITINSTTPVNIPPVIVSISYDSIVTVEDKAEITVSAIDDKNIIGYLWSLDGMNYTDTSTAGYYSVIPSDTGNLTVMVKVLDNDGMISDVDTCIINVVPQSTITYGVTDIDGNYYPAKKYGNQIWSTVNLRTTRYNDGTKIPQINDDSTWISLKSDGYCFYDTTTDTMTQKKCGALYNWNAVKNGKLAPKGWHVPSDAEWDTLVNYFINSGYNYDSTISENKIAKSMASVNGWRCGGQNIGDIVTDTTLNNRSGFTAYPAGYRHYNGSFFRNGSYTYFWSSTPTVTESMAYIRYLHCITDVDLKSRPYEIGYGFSVRIVKD